jgi:hypothetical protein
MVKRSGVTTLIESTDGEIFIKADYDFSAAIFRQIFLATDGTFIMFLDNVVKVGPSTVAVAAILKPGDSVATIHGTDLTTGDLYYHCKDHDDDTMNYCVVCTNGVDTMLKYTYSSQLLSDYTGVAIGSFVASFYDALYLSDIANDGFGVRDDDYAVIWSDIGDGTAWITEYYQRRPEEGAPITGMLAHGDVLYLGKGGLRHRGQLWAIKAYSNFQRLADSYGPSNQAGMVSGRQLYFNMLGRILTPEGTWLSEPIHDLMISEDAGNEWPVRGIYNPFTNEVSFSLGNKIFIYNELRSSWSYHIIGTSVQVIRANHPGTPVSQLTGLTSLYNQTLTEMAGKTALLYIVDNTKLCIENFFNDDDGAGITATYTTKTSMPGGSGAKKHYHEVSIEAIYNSMPSFPSDNPNRFNVYGAFSDSPNMPTNELLGTIEIGENGAGGIGIDEYGVWASITIEHTGKNPATVYKIGLTHTDITIR